MIFPIGSFGHTGFTGTSLWMDPGSDTYVVLLANAIHPRGNPPISNLRGEVATAVAQSVAALHRSPEFRQLRSPAAIIADQSPTLTGIDVLESDHFAELTTLAAQHNNTLRLGILTNQSGARRARPPHDRHPRDRSLQNRSPAQSSPRSSRPSTASSASRTPPPSAPRPTPPPASRHLALRPARRRQAPLTRQLKDLDAVVIDLQDAGVRTYTYETVTGYFLEAAAREAARLPSHAQYRRPRPPQPHRRHRRPRSRLRPRPRELHRLRPDPCPPRHDARRARPLLQRHQTHRRPANRRRHAALDPLRVLRPDRPSLG